MEPVLPRKQDWYKAEWRLARKRALASKDPVCAICHKYIDVQLPMTDPNTGLRNPLSVEIDHIVPRSRGGALYDLDNLQLSHSKCNRKKGARMSSDYEGFKADNPVPISNNW